MSLSYYIAYEKKKTNAMKEQDRYTKYYNLHFTEKINNLISENYKFNLNLPLKPFYDCSSFPSTLSVYFCTNIIPLFHK